MTLYRLPVCEVLVVARASDIERPAKSQAATIKLRLVNVRTGEPTGICRFAQENALNRWQSRLVTAPGQQRTAGTLNEATLQALPNTGGHIHKYNRRTAVKLNNWRILDARIIAIFDSQLRVYSN